MTGFIHTHVRFLATAEGGRAAPVFPPARGYAPHLRRGPGGEALGVRLVDGPPVVHPGEAATLTWEPMYEGVDYTPLQPGAAFDVLEGPRRVGTGTVLQAKD